MTKHVVFALIVLQLSAGLAYAAPQQTGDFIGALTPYSQNVLAGESTSFSLTLMPLDGFSGNVALSVSGLPAGATGSWSPATVAGGSGTSILTINTATSTPVGTYTPTLTGTSGSIVHSTIAGLTVSVPVGDFIGSVSPYSRSIVIGDSTSFGVTLMPVNGFDSNVTMGTSGLPPGATASWSPAVVPGGSGVTTLTIVTTTATPAGTYTVSLMGKAGPLSHMTTVDLTVSSPVGDFIGALTPNSQSVEAGSTTTFGLTLTPLGGFTGNVNLSVSGLPPGATGSWSPAIVTGGSGPSTLTINTTSSTPPGTYSITLTGTSSIITHSTQPTLVVSPLLTAPSDLIATATSPAKIYLIWNASTETGGTISQYLVQRCQGTRCTNFAQVGTSATASYTDTGLTASTTYSYQVQATDSGGGLSGFSDVATATTTPPISVSITPTQSGLTLSQTLPFTATVTNDVGAAGVTWSSSGGTLTGQTLTAATFSSTTAGSFTITATSNVDNTQSASATIGVTNLSGIYTYHNDLSRDGVNSQEYALTTTNVAAATFGKLFSCTTDGPIYAQPLWVGNLRIGGGTHNVVFVATVHDTVFAFDADARPCVTYWAKSLLGSGEVWLSYSDVGATDIYPDIGIIGTPVIEPLTNTIYVVAKSKTSGTNCTPATSCFQRLHALSLIDGSEQYAGPVSITSAISVPGTGDGSSGGNVAFNTLTQNQRPGLALSGGVVYVTWASHGDNQPYHGWVLGYNETTLALVATLNCNPNGSDSGIWMSGGAPAADSSGNLYFLTGNGTFDANTGGSDYGDSTVKLSTSGGLAVAGYFTPADQLSLEDNDTDHGAGGAAILVDQPVGAPVQHLVIGGGKEGNMFLLNRDNMGGYGGNFTPNDSNAVQKFSIGSGIFSTASFFNNGLYVAGIGASLQVFAFNTTTGQFNPSSTSQSPTSFGFPGATPSISALGTANAIVWAIDNSQYCTGGSAWCGPAVLHAYDATNLATELWNSSQTQGDAAGNAVKFTVPTVANGKVYIGTQGNDTIPGELDIYGLKPN